MMDCKAMATPMASNLKLLSDASSESVDATMYHQMIGSLRYLKGTIDYGLKHDANQKINLKGYVDSNSAGSAIDRKSTSGCCFSMGSGVISWFSRKKSCVALSTTEAEYVVACSASSEAVWLRKVFSNLFDLHFDATCIYWIL